MDDALRPFFIIGTERSGSNLLRLVLNTHSRLCIPHPPHIMKFMHALAPSYGDLHDDARFGELAADVARLIRWHTYPWDRPPQARELQALSRDRSLFALYAAAYESQMRNAGKARWGCKSTFMIQHDGLILRQYAAAQFILLVRDPRDVAVSARDSVFNHFHPYFVARLWSHEQRKGIAMLDAMPAERILRVHYEALLADPEGEVRRVCAFLGEAFEPAVLRFFESDEARKSASLCLDWRNTGGGILTANTRKYERLLSPDGVAVIESVAGAEMDRLGYPRVFAEPPRRPGRRERLRFWLEEKRRQAEVEWRSFRRDRNFPLRVRKALLLLWLRAKRAWRALGGAVGRRSSTCGSAP